MICWYGWPLGESEIYRMFKFQGVEDRRIVDDDREIFEPARELNAWWI
jgi:hypothetical protein